jgi:hypothetical protein
MTATTKIPWLIIWVAVVHCLLTLFVAPIGWEHLYSWDSPHWQRIIWACLFDMPLVIIFEMFFVFHAPYLIFVLIPLNSFVLSWMFIKPIQMFFGTRQTGQRCDFTGAVVRFALAVIVFAGIAVHWIPGSIISQKEAGMAVQREIQEYQRTNDLA